MRLPERPLWQPPFVVKSRHGSNQRLFVRSTGIDWKAAVRTAQSWTRRPYGQWLDEWGYRDIPRGIIVEPFIGPGLALPDDYKIYVFGGKAQCIKVDRDRETKHWRAIYNPSWEPIWQPEGWANKPPPVSLPDMICAAEILGREFDFVRVDFYDVAGKARFGEMTFYPGSGLSPLPSDFDFWLGRLWRDSQTLGQPAGSGCVPLGWGPIH
jgi:hypothetical protein